MNLAMTSFMFRPDGYFSSLMKKITSAICRIGGSRWGIFGTYPPRPPPSSFFFLQLKYSESMHTAAVV